MMLMAECVTWDNPEHCVAAGDSGRITGDGGDQVPGLNCLVDDFGTHPSGGPEDHDVLVGHGTLPPVELVRTTSCSVATAGTRFVAPGEGTLQLWEPSVGNSIPKSPDLKPASCSAPADPDPGSSAGAKTAGWSPNADKILCRSLPGLLPAHRRWPSSARFPAPYACAFKITTTTAALIVRPTTRRHQLRRAQ